MSDSLFRPYSGSDAFRSDRSAGDRGRHRAKVRKAIRENIADIVSEESIIGQNGDKLVKVPIRGIKEYRFVFGDNQSGIGSGDGNTEPGQKVGSARPGQGAQGQGGNQPGVDYYETEITLDELIEIAFEDLELPELESKKLRTIPTNRNFKRKGYTRAGVRAHLDKKRTLQSRVRRRIASRAGSAEEEFPFHMDDLIFRRLRRDDRPQSNAVVVCMMDTSGSMDTVKKYLARCFFFLIYQFVRARYANVEVVFIAHHMEAKEVTEEEFFHKGESGGTCISSAYVKALEVIRERYHPALWNVYAFHCSDGDNFPADNPQTVKAAQELAELANLFGYGEIKPATMRFYESSMLEVFKRVEADCFHAVRIQRKEDIWPAFKALLTKDRGGAVAAEVPA